MVLRVAASWLLPRHTADSHDNHAAGYQCDEVLPARRSSTGPLGPHWRRSRWRCLAFQHIEQIAVVYVDSACIGTNARTLIEPAAAPRQSVLLECCKPFQRNLGLVCDLFERQAAPLSCLTQERRDAVGILPAQMRPGVVGGIDRGHAALIWQLFVANRRGEVRR